MKKLFWDMSTGQQASAVKQDNYDEDHSWGYRICQCVSQDTVPWAGDTSAGDVHRRKLSGLVQSRRTPSNLWSRVPGHRNYSGIKRPGSGTEEFYWNDWSRNGWKGSSRGYLPQSEVHHTVCRVATAFLNLHPTMNPAWTPQLYTGDVEVSWPRLRTAFSLV